MEYADDSAYGQSAWQSPPDLLTVDGDDLHVWQVDLSAYEVMIQNFRAILSPDEIERADRFIRPVHGHRFSVGRGALRQILARYVSVQPKELVFEYNEHGKPSLAKPNESPFSFNVSHTGDCAVIAVGRHASVGIDIERYRETMEVEKLAQRYFAPEEVSSLMKMKASKRKEAFFRCWSTKEAFIKVVGRGLSIGLSNFEVEMEPARPPCIIKTVDTLATSDTWMCKQLPMGDSIAGVVAVEGNLGELKLYHYID